MEFIQTQSKRFDSTRWSRQGRLLESDNMKTYKIPKKESETMEFKTSFNMETIETLVVFANAKGGKYVYRHK